MRDLVKKAIPYLKGAWWILLVGLLSYLLFLRLNRVVAGSSTLFDAVVLLLWFGLVLSPLYTEVGLFGVKLRREIKELRDQVTSQVAALRSELHTVVGVHSVVSPQFILGGHATGLPSAAEMPNIEEKIERAVRNTLSGYGIERPASHEEVIDVPDYSDYLFRVRYNLEKELRRIWIQQVDEPGRYVPIPRLLNALVESERVSPNIIYGVREVYRIASAAIHGEEVEDRHVEFVQRMAPELLTSLRAIGSEAELE